MRASTDSIARSLGLDAVEFRRKNLLRDGTEQATGTVMRDAAAGAVLERLSTRIGWDQPFDRGAGTVKRGHGIAIGFKASISPTTSAASIAISA